jgi:hypothetical protein
MLFDRLGLYEPRDIRRIEDREPLIVLVVRHASIHLEVIQPGVPNICAV